MPPELLSNNFREEDFMSFRRADIYSLSLVLWEIVSRTQLSDEHTPAAYKLPYEDDVSAEPTLQAMELIVCQQKMRPAFPSTDGEKSFFEEFVKLYFQRFLHLQD